MKTRTDEGRLISPARLLEMLEFRFGAFKAIAYAASELADKEPDFCPAMDRLTASAILEFGDDLHQAYVAALEWLEQDSATIYLDGPCSCEQPHEDLPPELMLAIIERSLDNIPDDAKPQVRQETIAMFAEVFEQAGLPLPEWVSIGQSRWGSHSGGNSPQ